jgi:hypothetical protein
MKSLSLCALSTVLPLLVASAAMAAPYTVGDVFASVGDGQVKEFTPTGTLVQTLTTAQGSGAFYTTGSVFDSSGNFYVTQFGAGIVSKFATGSTSGSNFASVGGDEESLTRDKSNNFFVGEADGGGQITELNSSGSTIHTFTAATQDRGTDWVDLAANQTTLYYTSEGSNIMRYDTVSGQLSNFETGKGGVQYALRILSDGGVLVADSSNVLRYDSSGNIIHTYTFGSGSLFALNLDPDGTTFWTGDLGTGEIYRVNIATGAIVTQFNAGANTSLAGLSIFGEITQGGGNVPEPTSVVFLATVGAILMLFYRKRFATLR